MQYPPTLTLKELESCRKDYRDEIEFLRKIEILYQGGKVIESHKQEFLQKRLDEAPEEYNLRLGKFVYSNLLADNIQKILSRFSTGQIHLSGISENNLDKWNYLRENLDYCKKDEKVFLSNLLRDLLKYGKVYVQVDKPYSEVIPVSKAQEEELNLSPYLVSYSPFEVLNEASGGKWFKIRTVEEINNPWGDNYQKVCWKFVDDEVIAEYSLVCELGPSGKINHLIDPATGKKKAVSDKTIVTLEKEPIYHGFSGCPIVRLELPGEKYAASQAYLKLIQHLNLENAVTDTAIAAGYVQRVLKPNQAPENDFEVTSQDTVRSDNQHIIVADRFSFEEISGSSIATNLKFLERIELQIKSIICLGAGSIHKEALMRAAASKQMDTLEFELSLREFGTLVTAAYQDILQKVAFVFGEDPEIISVTGLDSFDLNTLSDDVDLADKIINKHIEEKLSPLALKMFYDRISQSLNPNASAEEKELIKQKN